MFFPFGLLIFVAPLLTSGEDRGHRRDDAAAFLAAGIRAYRLGRGSFDVEQLARAKRFLARAVELKPSPEGYFYLGSTLGLMSKPRTAVRAYIACLGMDAMSVPAHQNVAQLFEELGNRSAALAHYRRWAELAPGSASARKALAMSHLWSRGSSREGARLCAEACELAPEDPGVPFDCAQSLTLLLPPDAGGHFQHRLLPLFRRAQEAAFHAWRRSRGCPRTRWDFEGDEPSPGGEVYGREVPETFGGRFSWEAQRYVERGVRIHALRDVVLSGNEGVITRGCDVFVPYYDAQLPWHENLPQRVPEGIPRLDVALWLLVMFPANFFSFLVDELARLAVWLTLRRQRLPLLVPADRGRLKGFMEDWLALLGGFEVVPYDVRPHFMGAEAVAAPRLRVRELHVVDWVDPPNAERRDVFLLPPRWALERLRGLLRRAEPRGQARRLLWIQRARATTRRVVNEEELLAAVRRLLGALPEAWEMETFSDSPLPTAAQTLRMFQNADIVVGFHGSGQANQVFCRPGTGIVDVNLPEPHSQYTAHNSYALGLRYRLVMMRGVALHQAVNVMVLVEDVEEALRSLLREAR